MSGWVESTLGEVAEIGAGNSAPQDKRLFKEGIHPLIRTSDVGQIRFGSISTAADLLNEEGVEGLRLFPKGTILMPKSGASTFLNHRVEMAEAGYVSSHLATVYARPNLCDGRFLLYYLSTVRAQDLIQDHKYPSLTLGTIGGIPVPLPPLDEQKRIVAKLDQAFAALDRGRANAEANLADAKDVEKILNRTYLSELGSTAQVMGDVCDIYQPKTISTKELIADGQYVVFGANGKIGRYNHYNHAEPEVLVTCRGATCGQVNVSEPFSWVTGNAMVVRPKAGLLRKDFLEEILRNAVDWRTVITGAAQPQITRTTLAPVRIPVPDSTTQEALVRKMKGLRSHLTEVQQLTHAKLSDIATLRQSLLQAAFSGQLT